MNGNKYLFKPKLETYGKVRKYRLKLSSLLLILLVITPFTNWLIPVSRMVKGSLEVRL
jgi:hypothetical protein